MKILVPDPFSLLYGVHPFLPGRDAHEGCALCLGLLAGFPLQLESSGAPAHLLSVESVWQIVDGALPEGDVFDLGLPKPCSEFLVYGACHAAEPVQRKECRVQVGETGKSLKIIGPRFYRDNRVTEPEPFTRMPVLWDRAYGGPGHDFNPNGKGHAPLPDGLFPLPNVVGADDSTPDSAPDSPPQPVGFTAVPQTWPCRRELLGEYDAAWLRGRYPGLPERTSPEFCCAAPKDQRMPGYFSGGESILIRGMHPERELLRGVVPPLRGRAFVLRRQADGDVFEELPCRMETLWLFPEREAGVLLFRALASVRDESLEDLAAVFALLEDAHPEPVSPREYERQCRAALAGEGEAEQPPAPAPEKAAPRPKASAADAAYEKKVRDLEKEVDERLGKLGVSREQAGAWLADGAHSLERSKPPEWTPPPIDEAKVLQWLRERQLIPSGPESPDKMGHVLQRQMARPDLSPEVRAELDKALLGFNELQAVLAEMRALAGNAGASETMAPPSAVPDAPPAPGEPLHTAQALALVGKNRDLSFCDLTQCDLSGQDLSGVNLEGALLSGVTWSRVDFTGADLRSTLCDKAVFTHCIFDRALLDHAVFEGAECAGCSARSCSARNTQFQYADLSGMDFQGAALDHADCAGASLQGVRCKGVTAPGLRLQGADLSGADFAEADLRESRADGTTMGRDAVFSRANMEDANWAGAALPGVRCEQALLDRADLGGCDLSNAVLILAVAKYAVLDRARLVQADLQGCDFFQASLRRADCHEAVIRDVNLYGADLYKCLMETTAMRDVNLERTIFSATAPENSDG